YAHGGQLNATSGGVLIDGESDLTANATADGGSGGVVSVAIMDAEATVGGSTQGYADGNLTVNASSLSIKANSTNHATPDGLSVAIGVVGGAGTQMTGTISRITEAYVGTNADVTTPTDHSSLTFTGGDVSLNATSMSTTTASPLSLSIGVANVSAAATTTSIT